VGFQGVYQLLPEVILCRTILVKAYLNPILA